MSETELMYETQDKRLKVRRIKENGYTFSTRKATPVINGNLKPDAVVIIANDTDGRQLIIRERRPVTGNYVWARPAGMIDEGETPQQAAIREIKEETGLDFHPEYGTMYSRTFSSPGWTDEIVAVVTGLVTGQLSRDNLHGDEDIDAYLMSPDDMAAAGLHKHDTPMSIWLALSLI